MSSSVGKEFVSGVGVSVKDGRLDQLEQLRINVGVDRQSASVYDGHVQTFLDGVVQEGAVHRLPDCFHSSEGEGEIGETSADAGVWEVGFDELDRLQELHRVCGMLFHSGTDGKNIGVEDNVLGWEVRLLDQGLVRALANCEFALSRDGLAFLIEGHDDNGGTIFFHDFRLVNEVLFPFFQGDTVYDTLSLHLLQTGLDDGKVRGVDHEGNTGHVGIGGQKAYELLDNRLSVDHSFVEIDIQNLGSFFDLFLSNVHAAIQVVFCYHPGEEARSGHITSFSDVDEKKVLGEYKRLQTGKNEGTLNLRAIARSYPLHNLRKGLDVVRAGTAATSDDVNETATSEVQDLRRHSGRVLVVFTHSVGEAGVRIGRDVARSPATNTLQEWSHLFRSQGTVEADAEGISVGNAGQEGLICLSGEGSSARSDDGSGDEQGDGLVSGSIEEGHAGEDGSLAVEGIEDSLDQQNIGTAVDQGFSLGVISVLESIEVDITVLGVLDFLGEGTGLVGRAHSTGDETRSGRIGLHHFLAGLLCQTSGLEVEAINKFVVIEMVVGLGNGSAAEGVCLDDVGASLKIILYNDQNNERESISAKTATEEQNRSSTQVAHPQTKVQK